MNVPDLVAKKVEPETPKSGNLNDELYAALKGTESTFSGSFYHCSTDLNAPNPGLHIEGLGLIGLPLNEREAQLLISRSAQAPFGKGSETVVDTKVRDTWEIDPTNISFTNPRWNAYVDELALKTVWSTLGVAPPTTKPRCELYKLLLYQPGSHFLPHQDTAKAPGMFATVVIVLPSLFQGGEVHVSHAGQTRVLDVSKNSAFGTSILAWYTDVMHEVKSITSGHRLALSYNLIHTSPNITPPSLPGQSDMRPLNEVLQKWKRDGFESMPDTPLIAYMLNHQYSADDLKKGQAGLKGRDASTIAQLLPVAESNGIVVCLGNLKRTVTGYAEDYGHSYHKRCYYDDDEDDEDEDVTMAEIEEDEYNIRNMIRIDQGGEDRENVDFGEFNIDQDSLVPEDPFDGDGPDGQEYEGYMGNGAGSLTQWYSSSVLLLLRSEDVTPVGISLKGYAWALRRLPLSNNPDPKSEEIVSAVLQGLESTKQAPYARGSILEDDRRSARVILAHAVAWKRHELWNRVIPYCGPALETANASITQALEAFDLELIKPGLTQLVQQSAALQVRFDVIKAIVAKVGNSNSEWVESLAKDALSSYRASAVADVPMLVEIAKDRGVGVIEASILPHVAKTGAYDFLMSLARALQEYCASLEQSSLPSDQTRDSIGKVIRQCVKMSILQWEVITTAPGYGAMVAQAKVNRLSELLDFCFLIEDFELCTTLANAAAKTGTYESRIAFAKTLHDHLKKLPVADENAGKREEFAKAIRTCVSAAVSHWGTHPALGNDGQLKRVHELVPFCFNIGQPSLCVTLFNAIRQVASYEVLVELAKTLHTQIPRIQDTDENSQLKTSLRKVTRLSFETAAQKWEAGLQIPSPYSGLGLGYGYYGSRVQVPQAPTKGPDVKTNRICEFVDSCFAVGDLSPCIVLFNTLLKLPAQATYDNRFTQIYTPLIPQLKSTLVKHGKAITDEPFVSFFRLVISLYLTHILAPKTPTSILAVVPTRSAGCNTCPQCKQLKTFLNDASKEIRFCAVQAVRTHLEKEIAKARIGDIVTTETIRGRSPHTLLVTKRPEILAQLTWKKTQVDAAAFVRAVAEDSELRKIMPDRYHDVVRAVQGTMKFTAPASCTIPTTAAIADTSAVASVGAQPTLEAPAPIPATAAAGPSTSTVPTTSSSSTAGTKRKYQPPPNTIAVIDLT